LEKAGLPTPKTIEDLAEVTPTEFMVIVPKTVISLENIHTLINFAKERAEINQQE